MTFVQVPRLPAIALLSAAGRPRDVSSVNLLILAYMLVAIGLTRFPSEYVALAVWSGGEIVTFACITVALQRHANITTRELLRDIVAPLAAATSMMILVQVGRGVLPHEVGALWRLLVLVFLGAASYSLMMITLGRRHVEPVVGMARLLLARDGRVTRGTIDVAR